MRKLSEIAQSDLFLKAQFWAFKVLTNSSHNRFTERSRAPAAVSARQQAGDDAKATASPKPASPKAAPIINEDKSAAKTQTSSEQVARNRDQIMFKLIFTT